MIAQNDNPMPLLKHAPETYAPRFDRFLRLIVRVRGLKPIDLHLWRVMDSAAFEDTETAFKIALMTDRTTRKTSRFVD